MTNVVYLLISFVMIVHEKQQINRLVQAYCPRAKDLFAKYGYRTCMCSGSSDFGEIGEAVNVNPSKLDSIVQGQALYSQKLAAEQEAAKKAAEEAAKKAAEQVAAAAASQQ